MTKKKKEKRKKRKRTIKGNINDLPFDSDDDIVSRTF